MCRVSDKVAFHSADAHSPDWSGKRNIRNAQRSRCAVDCQNVRIIFTVGAEQDRDDLRVVKISLRKEWPQGSINHARSERFLFRRTAFAFEIAARKFSRRCRFFTIIDREREIILTFFDCGGRDSADQDRGVAARDDDGPVGESGDFACFDRDLIGPNLGRDLLLHFTFPGCAVPGRSP